MLLIQVVTQPNEAESISIYNPTSSPIHLNNYYICDDEEYYKMQTEGDLSPSSSSSGFTARFPATLIAPFDTLVIVFNENYSNFYGTDFIPDLFLFGSSEFSMLETEQGSFGFGNNKINEISELIILFKWDGESNHLIKDVDYFVWSSLDGVVNMVDKSGIDSYVDDTALDDQLYFETIAGQYYAYSRIGTDEIGETTAGGNGITQHDETSENFRDSWEIIELFIMGCTNPEAQNYDPNAELDDGSCYVPFVDVINGLYDCENSNSAYYCYANSAFSCNKVLLLGMIVKYDYVEHFLHILTLEDENGYWIDLFIFSSDWEIGMPTDSLNYLTISPYNHYLIEAQGSVLLFENNSTAGIRICKPDNLTLIDIVNTHGCTNIFACNYNEDATVDDGSCIYYDECGVCGGNGIPDGKCDCDGNVLDCAGECGGDDSTCTGCMNDTACNYNDCNGDEVLDDPCTIEDNQLCSYPEEVYLNCDGTCITDTDSDTVCDNMDVCEGYDDTVDSDGDGTPDGCDLSIYEGIIPEDYSISSIYPNPFNPITNITYGFPENTEIQITVFDMSGTHITTLVNSFQIAGYHTINWNASSYPSGVYLIRMDNGEFTQTQKVVLVK